MIVVAVILRQDAIQDGLHEPGFLGREEPDRRHVLDAGSHHVAGRLVPEPLLAQRAVAGVVARLRHGLEGQSRGRIGGLHHVSLRSRLASRPMNPLAANSMGAKIGGPYMMLYRGIVSPQGRRSMPR